MMLTSSPFLKPLSGCQLSTHVPLPPTLFISSLVTTWPYTTLPTLSHMTTKLSYLHGIVHLPLSFPHIGTQASHLCGHWCARAEPKTQEPGKQPFKLVCVHPYPPSTAFSLHLMSNKRPDNAHIISGRYSGNWIMERHSFATAPLTTMLLPNPLMDIITPSL